MQVIAGNRARNARSGILFLFLVCSCSFVLELLVVLLLHWCSVRKFTGEAANVPSTRLVRSETITATRADAPVQ